MNKNRVLFYSSVKNKELFNTQKFYVIDIEILESLGLIVTPTNRISDFWKFWKYDIGFYYFYKKSFFPGLIAKFFHKRNYFTGGIDDFSSENKKIFNRQKLFFYLSYLVSDKCFIVSNSDFTNIKTIYNNKLINKLYFSYHGIKLDDYICSEDALLRKDSNFMTIAWQGNKSNVIRKGIDNALYIFFELRKYKEFKDSLFYILGKSGPGTDYLKDLCNTYGVTESVIFTDEVTEDEKIKYLKNNRYYFQLSVYEGFGIAALEALAEKNIIIHSGNGGLKDVVADDGIIVYPEESIDSIYNKICNYNQKKLHESEIRICNSFSINHRRNDFENVIFHNK